MPLNSEETRKETPAIDVAAVVVWYNPTEQFVNNLLTYQPFCKNIYIIDNSEKQDNSLLAKKVPQCQYLWNHGNLGVAKALNQGCQQAMDDGFNWVMTMDQDSSWDKDQIRKYLERVRDNKDQSIVSFAPTPKNETKTTSVLGDIKRKILKKTSFEEKTELLVDRVITSGNIISLETWNQIGRFYEPLFIDEVDYEFCYRLKNKGFNITQYNNIQINQEIGEGNGDFFPKLGHHGKRCYYIVRNSLYIRQTYPSFFFEYQYKKQLFRMLALSLVHGHVYDIQHMIKGIMDWKKQKKK